jgi:hypothetical protein
MPVSSFPQPLAAVAPQLPDVDLDESVDADAVTKCGRCRLNFVRHPSISASDSPKWWLCSPCRSRLLGDETRTSARWSS